MEGGKMWNILKIGFNYYKRNFKTISLMVLCFYVVFFVYFKLFVINSDLETEFNNAISNKIFEEIDIEVKSNGFDDVEKKTVLRKFYGIGVSNNSIGRVEEKYKVEEENKNESNDTEVGNIFEKEGINENESNDNDVVIEKIFTKEKDLKNNTNEFNNLEDNKLVKKQEDKNINGNKYIVSNSKCRLLVQNPWDESVKKFIEYREFEPCASTNPLLSLIRQDDDGNFSVVINEKIANEYYNDFINCCWSSITKIQSRKSEVDYDIKFNVSECKYFKDQVQLPAGVELVKVVCRSFENFSKKILTTDYENIHVVLNDTKVKDHFEDDMLIDNNENKKISVLVLGIDSLSRLNFIRSFPKTEQFLYKTGWSSLKGYNKIGDNTYSNLMAVLSGLNESSSSASYKSEGQHFLDDYPFIWKDFKRAGYVTAFGEDKGNLGTFNFEKTGFVDPPTDYYLKPYIVATEKFLKTKHKYGNDYCTGSELAFDRIFNYALDFAVKFLDRPYFGFFWSNSVTHYDINAASSLDSHLLEKLEYLEQHGVFNNTLVILLSDHGMRWGKIRNTLIGWYEDRLPFVYLRIPESFKNLDNNYNTLDIIQALKMNERRLTSPYDLHETLRDILEHAGGKSSYRSDCPTCQSLFKSVPFERGCENIGVSPHWCACSEFTPRSPVSEIAEQGAQAFLSYIDNVIKDYENDNGRRLCTKLMLKKIHRFDEIRLKNNNNTGIKKFFYQIEVTPGNAVYEVTMNLDENKDFEVSEHEISRINSFKYVADCLSVLSHRKYCYCSNLLV